MLKSNKTSMPQGQGLAFDSTGVIILSSHSEKHIYLMMTREDKQLIVALTVAVLVVCVMMIVVTIFV